MVRATGVEPACLAALDPKSSVSANFTTPATGLYYIINFINQETNISLLSMIRYNKIQRAIEKI